MYYHKIINQLKENIPNHTKTNTNLKQEILNLKA